MRLRGEFFYNRVLIEQRALVQIEDSRVVFSFAPHVEHQRLYRICHPNMFDRSINVDFGEWDDIPIELLQRQEAGLELILKYYRVPTLQYYSSGTAIWKRRLRTRDSLGTRTCDASNAIRAPIAFLMRIMSQ